MSNDCCLVKKNRTPTPPAPKRPLFPWTRPAKTNPVAKPVRPAMRPAR